MSLVRFAGTLEEGDGLIDVYGSVPVDDRLTGTRIDSIVLCVPIGQTERIAHLRAQLRRLNCDIYVAGDFLDLTWASGTLDRLGQLRVIKIEGRAAQ